jgi:signal transduction histidine kinase
VLRLAKSRGLSPTYVEGAQHIKVGPNERGMVAAQRRPLVASDMTTEPKLQDFLSLAQSEGFRSLAEVPMIAQSGGVGTLAIYYAEPHPFTQAELDVLQTFANQVAAAVNNARLYERTDQALARRVEELAALEEIGREFTGTLEVARIAESIVERAMQVTGAQTAALMLVGEGSECGRFVAQRGYTPELVESLMQKPWPVTQGIMGRVLRTNQAVNAPDVRLEPDYVITDPNVRSHLAVPIVREGHALGVLTVGSHQLAAFDKAAVTFTQQIANQAAIALENARLFAERMSRIYELSQLYEASLALTGSLDLRQVLDRIVSGAHELTGADTVLLHLYNPDTDSFQRGASAGAPMSGDSTAGIRPQGMTRRALHQRRTILVGDTHEEPDINSRLVTMGIRSVILVPLISHDQVLGVLNAYSSQPHKFTEADLQLVSALGNQASAAIENARLFQTVAEVRDKMRAILDSAHDGILMFDLAGRVVMANPALEKLLSIQRGWVEGRLLTEMLDRPGLDIASQLGYSPPAILAALDQLKRGEHLADTHDVYQIARPTPRFVERSGMPVQDAAGKTVGWMITLRDVTEERELQQMRSDLTSMIIHDLRSPLSAIYSGVLLLREMTPAYGSDQAIQDTFSTAEHSCLRLIGMVNSLLDISKLEAGRMKLDQQLTDLKRLVTGVLDGLSTLAQEQKIALSCDVPEACQVFVDEEKIGRVLTNLVDNAFKFTPENGQVKIVAEPAPNERGFVRCSVHDEGPGIPLEYREKIFDRFAQGPSKSSRRRGTGLGLAFCKLTVEAHGGRIWVESQGDRGSTFYLTLPLAEEWSFTWPQTDRLTD